MAERYPLQVVLETAERAHRRRRKTDPDDPRVYALHVCCRPSELPELQRQLKTITRLVAGNQGGPPNA